MTRIKVEDGDTIIIKRIRQEGRSNTLDRRKDEEGGEENERVGVEGM